MSQIPPGVGLSRLGPDPDYVPPVTTDDTAPLSSPTSPLFPRQLTDLLGDLGRHHPGWVDRFEGPDPVYAILPPAIGVLARATKNGAPLFDPPTAAGERAFADLCESAGVVGFHAPGPIEYPLLSGRPAGPDVDGLGWTPGQQRAVRELAARAGAVDRRLRGVAGWLMTDPAFLDQVAATRRACDVHLCGLPPPFPLTRSTTFSRVGEEGGAAALKAVRVLLDRWGLTALAAWDLPVPQGPLLSLPPGVGGPPAHGVYVFVPFHYPTQGDDALRHQLMESQRQRAAELGVDPSSAGNTHFETYGQMFRVAHLEAAVRRRFACPPRGLVGAVEAAAAAAFDLSPDRVGRLRKWAAACRAGRRDRVKDLRVTS